MSYRDDLDAQARGFGSAAGERAMLEEVAADSALVGEEAAPFDPQDLPPSSEWFTTEEVAKSLKLTAATIRGYIRAGELKASGRPYRIHRNDLGEWKENRAAAPRRGAKPRKRSSRRAADSTFTDLARKAK
jgi:excisionase family DNA binding protein